MTSYEHKVKNIYLGSPYNEGTPIIPGDYTLLRGPCDEGFHVPLQAERHVVVDAGLTYSQVTRQLHIPFSGYRTSQGTWTSSSSNVRLWSSTPYDSTGVYVIKITTSDLSYSNKRRGNGQPIRGFRNTPIIPDETRTETVTGKVWYNQNLGLITVCKGTNQYVTLQDKNVGATVVWNYGDTLTNNNRGKHFQRGNNYGFTYGSTGDTSSNPVNTRGYGPSNPYSSSTFIAYGDDWSTVRNDNLRGYTDFNS